MPIRRMKSKIGEYIPGFFCIELMDNCDLSRIFDLEAFLNKNDPVFFHEYIHFLQDVSTIFGLANMAYMIDDIGALAYTIAKQSDHIIRRPVDIDKEQYAGVISNRDLFSLYLGYDDFDECEKICSGGRIKRIFLESNACIEGYEQAKGIKIVIESKNGKSECIIDFGALTIMESMAHIIESHVFGPDGNCPTLPYNLCKMIAKHLYHQFGENDILVAALCEVSLMSYHPGHLFYNALLYMNKYNLNP